MGRFRLVELLGEGGMGRVYRADDTVLGRAVALKVLYAGTEGAAPTGGADAAKLLHEARAAAALNHPNAIAVFDVGEADGVAYIAMELLRGKALRAYVRDAEVPLAKRLAWLLDVAAALEAAQKRGIVHRDVKPENVFVRSDGVIKVLDFGIARRVSAPVDPTAATQGGELTMTATATAAGTGGQVAGTLLYMAPEQLRGEPLEGRTDQFGWGVVAYELLTGSVPWDSSLGALQVVSQILSRTPEAPSARRAEIPEAVDRVVLRALAKVPAERFEDMRALIDALGEAIHGEPGDAERATAEAPRAARTAKGGRTLRVALLRLAVVAVVLGGLVLAWRARRARPLPGGTAAAASAGPAAGPPDYGSKMSANEAAVTAYRAGMQAMVDASSTTARNAFARATKLDPGFAAAHLRRALLMRRDNDVSGREHLDEAFDLRNDLGAHDRAVLDALATAVRHPSDTTEIESKLGLLEAAPDADSQFAACQLRSTLLVQNAAAIPSCQRAWRMDGSHAAAHRVEGASLLRLDKPEAARGAWTECLRIAPSAADCLDGLFDLEAADGRCQEALALARKLVAIEPEKAAWRAELLYVLLDLGELRDTYEDAMQQYLSLTTDSDRAIQEAQTRFTAAVLRGDFSEAEARSGEWQRAIAHQGQELPNHWNAFYQTWLLERETGRLRAAGELAERYEKQRAAWDTMGDAVGVELAAVLYQSGKLGRTELAKRRSAHAVSGIEGWLSGFGHAVVTSEDAKEAVVALDRLGEVPRGLPTAYYGAVGGALLRAGDAARAIPSLKQATASCMGAIDPFDQTRAYADLAASLAETGDQAGACAAAGVVQSRWGNAEASTTARMNRRLSQKLGCLPPGR